MALKIILKKRYLNKLYKLLTYLEAEWGHQVAKEFLRKVDKKLDTLSRQPYMGVPSEKVQDVRSVLITRHNRLYYKVTGDRIVVLNLYDTRRKPAKNPYKRK